MNIWAMVGIIIALFGVILVYDARQIAKNSFGFGDQNEGTTGLKILGFILCVISGLLIFFNI